MGLGTYKYNLDCTASDFVSGEILFDFPARQYVEKENKANFVSGGIASFSQMTIIATTDSRVSELEPYKSRVSVEGVNHMLTSVKVFKYEIPGGYKSLSGAKEYILTLE